MQEAEPWDEPLWREGRGMGASCAITETTSLTQAQFASSHRHHLMPLMGKRGLSVQLNRAQWHCV